MGVRDAFADHLAPPADEPPIPEARQVKLERLRAAGVDPYPHLAFPRREPISALYAAHDPAGLAGGEAPVTYRVAGRAMARRKHPRATFIDVEDQSGTIEACLPQDRLETAAWDLLANLDAGDIVGLEGRPYATPRGELGLRAHGLTLLAKSLRPPPRRHGAPADGNGRPADLDLVGDQRAREMLFVRARTIAALRDWMNGHGFVEVDTPVLLPVVGGAMARPFITHHRLLDRELSLRISVEPYLRRCVAADLERVYELGRCFRNEGLSPRHSPEFTVMEWSVAYADYLDVAAFIEEMVVHVAREAVGTTRIDRDGVTIDLAPPWRRVSLRDAVREAAGVDVLTASVADLAAPLGGDPAAGWGPTVMALYAKLVEPALIEPTIVFDFPVDGLALVKRHRDDPRLAESFEVVIGGLEVSSGDTELNDPEEQRQRFLEPGEEVPGAEDEPPHPHDEECVRSLQYGSPPSAGAGVGIERLLMVLTGSRRARDVIPFPIFRSRK